MKKIILAAALIGTIGIATTQIASAQGGYGRGGGFGNCNGYGSASQAYSEEDAKAYEAFRSETVGVRKEIVVKRSELNALYRQENPDPKAVATLTGDLFDLQNQLTEKALKAGVKARFLGHGPEMMVGNGGYHRGWGMMDR